MNIYLSSSWKNRERVRVLAEQLREAGHQVYDFTDSRCRDGIPEIPPEAFPEQFDPTKHLYRNYIQGFPHWRAAVERNRQALRECDAVVLMLPCGMDAHADAYYGLGLGKRLLVVGQPRPGERTPTHLWADGIADRDEDVLGWLDVFEASPPRTLCKARLVGSAGGNTPQDCGWPHCGCDPHADRVLEALEEDGTAADAALGRALRGMVPGQGLGLLMDGRWVELDLHAGLDEAWYGRVYTKADTPERALELAAGEGEEG
jgi:hypothetical protein